jgi:outer membrane protein assembly factor BamB
MEAPPTIDSGRAILATSDGHVVAVSVDDGVEAWRSMVVSGGFDYALWLRTAPAVAGDRYVVAGQRGGVSAIARDDGRVLWTFDPPAIGPVRAEHYSAHPAVFSSGPAVTGDVVWIGGDDGVVRALDLGTGSERWSVWLGAPILAGIVPSVASARGAMLYVATWDGAIHALGACAPAPTDSGDFSAPVTGCGCSTKNPDGTAVILIVFAICRRRRSQYGVGRSDGVRAFQDCSNEVGAALTTARPGPWRRRDR